MPVGILCPCPVAGAVHQPLHPFRIAEHHPFPHINRQIVAADIPRLRCRLLSLLNARPSLPRP